MNRLIDYQWVLFASHQRCSVKNVLKSFAKFTRKHLYQSIFFNRVIGWRLATLLKERIRYRCFL